VNATDEMLGAIAAAGPIPGGCEHCEATQVVRAVDSGVWRLTVRHQDDCPVLARLRAQGGAR
jgi:hypothetical protein